jgi:predicted metal-dependent hydrolase
LPQPPASTRGQHHHLCESFLRVNHAFFHNQLNTPQLRWSHRPTSRILGHYLSSHDQVMISTSLDHPNVPRFVFDFVMFHELLHKKHGASYQNGRRIVHSSDFLAEERTYPRYNEAESFLQSWAQTYLSGG